MFFLILILLIYPAFSQGLDDVPFHILEESRRLAAEQGALASDPEQEELERALRMSLEPSPQEEVRGVISKANTATSKESYFKGLQADARNPAKSALNFIGYLIFLLNNSDPEYFSLFNTLDQEVWKNVLQKLGKTGNLAVSVVTLLDEVKQKVEYAESLDLYLGDIDLDLLNQVVLRLFSGAWGFSKENVSEQVMGQLKRSARGAGRAMGGLESRAFSKKIFQDLAIERKLREFKGDSKIQEHFFALYGYLSGGYLSQPPHRNNQNDLTNLARFAHSNFPDAVKEDIDLEMLVTQPEGAFFTRDILRAIKRTPALQDYLAGFDLDSPGLGENQGLLKNLQEIFQKIRGLDDYQAVKKCMEIVITALRQKGILNPAIDLDKLVPLLIEAVYVHEVNEDSMYDQAIADAVASNHPLSGAEEDLNDSLYKWLMDYVKAIEERNKIKSSAVVWKVIYRGKISGKFFEQGETVTPDEVQAATDQERAKRNLEQIKQYAKGIGGVLEGVEGLWPYIAILDSDPISLADNPLFAEIRRVRNLYPAFSLEDDTVAGVGEAHEETGQIKDKKYILDLDNQEWIENNGRALDYLIGKRLLSRNLKLPILLLLSNVGVMD